MTPGEPNGRAGGWPGSAICLSVEGGVTPHFVILQRFTPEGRKSTRESPAQIKQTIQQLGISGSASQLVFLTLGTGDIVARAGLPDDEAALKLVAQLAAQGHAESTVLRAFTLDEAERAMNG